MSIAAGVFGWLLGRVGFALDRQGLGFGNAVRPKTLAPWRSVLAAIKVVWTTLDGEEEGILFIDPQKSNVERG